MPTGRQERIEQMLQEDADAIRAAGYETTAQATEAALARYRAGNRQQAGGQQDTGQAAG
jgi:hypothetical protein